MAGKICNGSVDSYNIKDSRAYCDGMTARTTVASLAAAKALSPHITGTPEDVAFDQGATDAETLSGSTITSAVASCCGLVGVTVPAA